MSNNIYANEFKKKAIENINNASQESFYTLERKYNISR